MQFKSVSALVKAGPDAGLEEGEFIVYPSTFIKEPDSYGDVVAKGAFAAGIEKRKAEGIQLPGLYGHRFDDPDYFVAYATEEEEDEHGWRVRGRFDLDSPKGPQVYRLAKSGRLRELSFAYDALDEGQIVLEDGRKANELRALDVFEFSFVPIGANRSTSILALKSLTDTVLADMKAGRAISAKNEATLREAADQIMAAASNIKNVLQIVDQEPQDDGKATGTDPATDENPTGVKSKELDLSPAALLRLQIELANAEFATL